MTALPEIIANYFSLPANASIPELGLILAEDAVVRDERRAHQGLRAIRHWRIDTMTRTPFQLRPLDVEDRDGTVVVRTQISGAFPGSPVVLDHHFTLRNDRIAALEIV
ncbi:nuclear transport factor 2 family protein [Aurantimonas manganoxydans]|uniref:nuclear transport factor 2 family protein n=1 Tax=Aurantimonas manganoxydans TaxID=651183 RepID=UPI00030C5BAD|nr:nuclear transport factor 2 family protein [Aurantimonas manganoxydans]